MKPHLTNRHYSKNRTKAINIHNKSHKRSGFLKRPCFKQEYPKTKEKILKTEKRRKINHINTFQKELKRDTLKKRIPGFAISDTAKRRQC